MDIGRSNKRWEKRKETGIQQSVKGEGGIPNLSDFFRLITVYQLGHLPHRAAWGLGWWGSQTGRRSFQVVPSISRVGVLHPFTPSTLVVGLLLLSFARSRQGHRTFTQLWRGLGLFLMCLR